MTDRELQTYREGYEDALNWVIDHCNLDPEDEDRIKELIDT